eukprot:COSAG02_NODE_31544_length_531_cov_1.678241_1_plen_30_part_10
MASALPPLLLTGRAERRLARQQPVPWGQRL